MCLVLPGCKSSRVYVVTSIESFHHVIEITKPPFCCTGSNGVMRDSRLFKSF